MPSPTIKYPKPPILEALCEVHFDRPSFTDTEQTKMKAVWESAYADQRFIDDKSVRMEIRPNGVVVKQNPQGKRLICKSKDGADLVQISSGFLVVNRLPPYPGWNEFFQEMILRRVGELQEGLGASLIRRVSLRYINRLNIPQSPLVWEEWFNVPMPVPIEPKGDMVGFQFQLKRRLGLAVQMVVNMAILEPTTEKTSVVLDLDVIWEGQAMPAAGLGSVLDMVHAPHRLAFEGFLTDKLRALFF